MIKVIRNLCAALCVFIILGFLSGGCGHKDEKFDLSKIIKSRPKKNFSVYDYAKILSFPDEYLMKRTGSFKKEYNMEVVVVIIPSLDGKDVVEVSSDLFSNWNIGKDNNGRGILFLVSQDENLVKVEVGYALENTLTDFFCGYIERNTMAPFFENNQIDEGFSYSLWRIEDRIEGKLTDGKIENLKKAGDEYLSGGGGVKAKSPIGKFPVYQELPDVEKEYYSAQPTPELLWERYLEAIKNNVTDPSLGIYAESKNAMLKRYQEFSTGYNWDCYQKYSSCPYEIKEKGDYAVLISDPRVFFMKKNEKGWQIDFVNMRKWSRGTEGWIICGSKHPYIFPFKEEKYASRLKDGRYFYEYSNVSGVSDNFEEYLTKYERLLEEDPDNVDYMIKLAEGYMDLTLPHLAVPLFKKAILIEPDNPLPYKYLGLMYRDLLHCYKEAEKFIDKYIKLRPYDPKGYEYAGNLYIRLERTKENCEKAAKYWLGYAECSENNKNYGYNNAGYFYFKCQNYDKAEECFYKALKLNPRDKYPIEWLKKMHSPIPALPQEESSHTEVVFEQKPVSGAKAWALAASAVLTEVNGRSHVLLGTRKATEKNIEKQRKAIDEWWDIKTKKDLIGSLRWIKEGGHRKGFEKMGAYISSLNFAQYNQLLAQEGTNPESKNKINIVSKYYKKLGDKSLLGWDYSRYISLCRWGYLTGLLSEEETWQLIMPVVRMLQKRFDSWKDLGENYLIGRQYWSYSQTQKNGDEYEEAYQKLLNDPRSPWNTLPWDMNLN
ncbi:DUF1266 domain-containing protein [bacterium]|nr:DUF1266 domain-containing protein [bacterium]